ncbi:hypothetical protein C0991_002489 [Blastosporella zonata]|nr:hypothetical protein C0991_002489 [Blastosporella zonata]
MRLYGRKKLRGKSLTTSTIQAGDLLYCQKPSLAREKARKAVILDAGNFRQELHKANSNRFLLVLWTPLIANLLRFPDSVVPCQSCGCTFCISF